MQDKPETRVNVPQGAEQRKDLNTTLAVVNTSATLINTGLAAWNAHQSGKPKPPPDKPDK